MEWRRGHLIDSEEPISRKWYSQHAFQLLLYGQKRIYVQRFDFIMQIYTVMLWIYVFVSLLCSYVKEDVGWIIFALDGYWITLAWSSYFEWKQYELYEHTHISFFCTISGAIFWGLYSEWSKPNRSNENTKILLKWISISAFRSPLIRNHGKKFLQKTNWYRPVWIKGIGKSFELKIRSQATQPSNSTSFV